MVTIFLLFYYSELVTNVTKISKSQICKNCVY